MAWTAGQIKYERETETAGERVGEEERDCYQVPKWALFLTDRSVIRTATNNTKERRTDRTSPSD